MFQTFLFCCILAAFAITSTEAALNPGRTVTFSDRAVGAETSVTISFSLDTTEVEGTGSAAEAVVIKFPTGFVVDGVKTDTVETVKDCGGTTFGTITVSNQDVTLPLSGATEITADIQCSFRIYGIVNPPTAVTADNTGYEIAITGDGDAVTSTAIFATAADSIQSIGGKPTVYSVKRTCRSGGEAAGAAGSSITECLRESGLCYDCSLNGYSFYTEYVTACDAASDTSVRCDARMYSKSTLDIYFNTGGIEGTTTCAAFTKDTNVDTVYSFATDSNTGLISKSSAVITSKSASADNVISLTSLKPKTAYDVYCQTNDNERSDKVTMWTAPYPIITRYSYLRSTTSALATTGTAILKFTHGHALESGDTIVVSLLDKTTISTKRSYYSSAAPTCTATSGGSNLDLTGTPPAVDGTNGVNGALTITLNAASAAGNEIVVTCTVGLENPADGISTVYNLNVAGHNLIKGATGQSFAT